MRHFIAALLTGALSLGGTAAAEPIGNPFDGVVEPIPREQTMMSQEVVQHAVPYVAGVARCYRSHVPSPRARGEMDLYLVISGSGKVVHASVEAASGVPSFRLPPLDRCVRRETATWKFPVRRGFTNATIRYHALDTKHPISVPLPEQNLVARR